MTFYKKPRKSQLTLKKRLLKNKQYLQRRLLRISKRANWLKRKYSKRLKQFNKSYHISGYYTLPFKKTIYIKSSKIKKPYLKFNKVKQNSKQTKNVSFKLHTKFNIVNAVNKSLSNGTKIKSLFMYFI